MKPPTLLVMGAPRSGTTMLCSLLTCNNREVFIEAMPWTAGFRRKHGRVIEQLDAWGAKEVRHDKIKRLITEFPDAKRLWCIRNPIDSACSLAAFHEDQLRSGRINRGLIHRKVLLSCGVIAKLARDEDRFVFYEEQGIDHPGDGWVVNGDPSAALMERPSRQAEALRHAGRVTIQEQSPHRSRLSANDKAWVWKETHDYRQRFGYLSDPDIKEG